MKTAFGLDLAGYSTGKSGFARADLHKDNTIRVIVYEKHIFSEKIDSSKCIQDVAKSEKQFLMDCLAQGSIVVDIPIDLQNLTFPDNPYYVWQLIKRSVDYVFDALPPLADKIGAPVARFQNILKLINLEDENIIGRKIFETYPAASLRLLGLPDKGYKGSKIFFKDGKWNADTSTQNFEKGGLLINIVESFGFTSKDEDYFNDDEIDAAICAITGILDGPFVLKDEKLGKKVKSLMSLKQKDRNLNQLYTTLPKGYILLEKLPPLSITIERKI